MENHLNHGKYHAFALPYMYFSRIIIKLMLKLYSYLQLTENDLKEWMSSVLSNGPDFYKSGPIAFSTIGVTTIIENHNIFGPLTIIKSMAWIWKLLS